MRENPQIVPASTRIRRSRAHNVDSDRLARRRAFLLVPGRIGGVDSREELRARVVELAAVERELVARGLLAAAETRNALALAAICG